MMKLLRAKDFYSYYTFSEFLCVLSLNQLAINQAIREAEEEDEEEEGDEEEDVNISLEKEPALQRTRNRPKREV